MSKLTKVVVKSPGGFIVTKETKFCLSPDTAASQIKDLQSVPGDPKWKGPQAELVNDCHVAVRDFTLKRGTVFDVALEALNDAQKSALEKVEAKPAVKQPQAGGEG